MKAREINIRPEKFKRAMEAAKKEVASWPAWKRETRASQYPRPAAPVGAEKGGE